MNGEVFYPQVTQRISGNTAGATALISSGTMVLSGGNNITLSQNGQTIEVQGGAGGAGGSFSAGVSTIGNTLGNTGTVSNQLVFAGGNNITLSQSTNAGGATVTVQGAAGGAGGAALKGSGTYTQNTGTVEFANSNGITFGLSNNGTMTASHNGLTTARASNDAIGLNTAQTNVTWTVNSSGLSLNAGGYAGTATATTGNISITLNTAGLSLNAPAFLTTAAQSSASNISGVIAATASGAATNQTAQLSGAISFSNTNGISFFTTASGAVSGIGATVKTDYQTAGAYLTTARASNDAVGLNTAQTNVTWTVNSSGISLNAGAYLTTAMASNAATISNINFSAGTTSLNLSKLTFADSNGISFGLSGNSVVTGTVKTDYQSSNANYLTSQSNQAVSNSAGSFTFQTLNFSNANNVTWGTSAGGIVTASVAAPGGSNTPAVSNSAGSFTFSTLNFSNANNVTWGTSAGGIVTASVAAPGAAAENNWVNLLGANTAGNTTASGSTIGYSGINATLSGTNGSVVNISVPATSSLSATGGASLSTNGSTISIGAPANVTVGFYPEFRPGLAASSMISGTTGNTGAPASTQITASYQMAPMPVDADVVYNKLEMALSQQTVAGTGSATVGHFIGLYTLSGGTFSSISSWNFVQVLSQNSATARTASWWFGTNSTSNSSSISGNVSASFTGLRRINMAGGSNTLTRGNYYLIYAHTAATGGANINSSNSAMFNSQSQTTLGGYFGTNLSSNPDPWNGVFSSTTNTNVTGYPVIPASIHTSVITHTGGSTQWGVPVAFFRTQ